MPNDLIPLYSATRSLNVEYDFNSGAQEKAKALVSAKDIHAILAASATDLLAYRQNMTHGTGSKIYTKPLDDRNFATSAITFLYTDTSTEEGYLGEDIEQKSFSLGVSSTPDRILSTANFYSCPYKQPGVPGSKAARDVVFNNHLLQRVTAFSNVATLYDLPKNTKHDPDVLSEAIASPMFHETFHHSEQALMHYLSSAIGIQSVVETLQALDASYLYGIVLDIYTQRMLCCNCNACLIGLQNSHEQGFIANLMQVLLKNNIQPRLNNHLMLSTRVSASKPNRNATLDPLQLPTDDATTHIYDPDKTNLIFQAANRGLGTQALINARHYSLSSYSGSFFVSQSFKKTKLEEAIKLEPEKYFAPLCLQ